MGSLFTDDKAQRGMTPLAERMRPRTLSEVAGQPEVVDVLRELLDRRALPSLILWGPPGCGKTTIARLLAGDRYAFVPMSAVLAGVRDVRQAVEEAKERRKLENLGTLLFLDEIHRFNKAQQDVLLPHVEAGTIVLVGATTENPSFEVIGPLLSRCRVLVLSALEPEDIEELLVRALKDEEYGLGMSEEQVEPDVLKQIAELAAGDARFALNTLEVCAGLLGERETVEESVGAEQRSARRQSAADKDGPSTARPLQDESQAEPPAPPRDSKVITTALLKRALAGRSLLYDKGGEEHFNAISALHKSVRGSDPDAALYWTARMLEGGEDPKYLARRMIRMASEDIGLADPWALVHAVAVKDAVEFIGMPECNNALAQLAIYLACAPKSNAVYMAWGAAREAVQKHGALPPPLNIRNAPTRLMKELGYGKDYTYAHNYPGGFTPDNYWPEKLAADPPRLLHLKGLGSEKTLQERLRKWWGGRFTDKEEVDSVAQAAVPAKSNESKEVAQAAVPADKGELKVSRRRLPHWRLDGSAYFVTWRIKPEIPRLNDKERGLVAESIRFGESKRYQLYAYVVMDDHVHVALRPHPGEELNKIIHTWKSYSANQLQRLHGRQGAIWITESWDRVVRDEDELMEKCQYILDNPFKRWPELKDYEWVGIGN